MNLTEKEDYKKLTSLAKIVTNKFDKPELYDDFVQFASEAIVRGRKATVKQLFVDFIRQEFGDSRYELSDFKFVNSIQWEDEMDQEYFDKPNVDFNNIIENYEGQNRTILVLYYNWGLTFKEIGFTLGISESRVSQIFSILNKSLSKRYGRS